MENPIKYALIRVDTGAVMGAMHLLFDDTGRRVKVVFRDSISEYTVSKTMEDVVSTISYSFLLFKHCCQLLTCCLFLYIFSQMPLLPVVFSLLHFCLVKFSNYVLLPCFFRVMFTYLFRKLIFYLIQIFDSCFKLLLYLYRNCRFGHCRFSDSPGCVSSEE